MTLPPSLTELLREAFPTLDPESLPISVFVCGLVIGAVLVSGVIIDLCLLARAAIRPPDWSLFARRLRSRPWTWREACIIIVILAAMYSVVVALASASQGLADSQSDRFLLLSVVVQTVLLHGAGVLAVVLLMRTRRLSWRQTFGLDARTVGKNVLQGVIFYLAAMPLVAVAGVLYRLFLVAVKYEVEPQGVVKILLDPAHSPWLQGYLVVLALAVAPIAEELLFRGVAFPVLMKHANARLALCCVSILFACAHFHVPSVVPLFVLAAAFAAAYAYSDSILVPMVMHVLFNGVSLAVVFLVRSIPGLEM